jgi:large subunit ribosomal protein L6
MSRIGKQVIAIPKGVTVSAADRRVSVKGPKGELHLQTRPEVVVQVGDRDVRVAAVDGDRTARAFQGTTRALLASMVVGVTQGYQRKLEISGVGYQAVLEGKQLALSLGFNKPIKFPIPASVVIEVPNPTTILVKGCDKQQVGTVAAAIRKLRKPEPYKGKGIKYSDEIVRRKAGKAFASGGTT